MFLKTALRALFSSYMAVRSFHCFEVRQIMYNSDKSLLIFPTAADVIETLKIISLFYHNGTPPFHRRVIPKRSLPAGI
jgi:hypothetical protein